MTAGSDPSPWRTKTKLLNWNGGAQKRVPWAGERKLAARRNAGVLNARERLEYLLDDGSFLEAGLHAYSIRPETREKSACGR